jgi:DNA-binding response OmpR family regulator
MDQTTNNRIMVIGGDAHFSYLMQRYVRTSAHQIVFASLGEDVLAQARCEKPAAIVLVVDPPEAVGWQTLQGLKADHEAGKIPVIVCSWLDEEAHSLDLGADFYLRMPILYADFEAALAATLLKEQDEKSYQ